MYCLWLYFIVCQRCSSCTCSNQGQNQKDKAAGNNAKYNVLFFYTLQGKDNLSCYTFNTHAAKHLFCKTCGVQSFYRPRSNPDGYGVMPHCLDEGSVETIKIEACDGKNWENFVAENPEIQQRSKKKD